MPSAYIHVSDSSFDIDHPPSLYLNCGPAILAVSYLVQVRPRRTCHYLAVCVGMGGAGRRWRFVFFFFFGVRCITVGRDRGDATGAPYT